MHRHPPRGRPPRPVLAIVAPLAAAAVLAAACTSGTSSGPPAAARSAPPLSEAENALLRDAEQRLVADCMTERGFHYWAVPTTGDEGLRPLGFVLDDTAWARAHGYGGGSLARAAGERDANPNAAYVRELTEERQRAYAAALRGGAGTPEVSIDLPGGGTAVSRLGGCEGEAGRRLYGDLAAWTRADTLAANLTPLYVPEVTRDARFTEALAAWSACMAAAGLPYERPDQIRAEARRKAAGLAPDAVTAAEAPLAVAEAQCGASTGLAGTARRLEAEYRERLPEQYRSALGERTELARAALPRAREITGRTA
ncbi:hypothetical protein ACIQI7_21140 [Kitasatospora sp. NPDC092039]|uniref:hypothetical protein n=1 Tax=Kitasatospora sp. NPDC092039 TaxID=3364086 RepID=UPI0037FDFD1A